jgi:hypothetical protein
MPRTCLARSSIVSVFILFLTFAAGSLSAATTYDIEPLGFTDAEHTFGTSIRYSAPYSINESGQVIGWSARYSSVTNMGQSTWFYNDGATTRIGLIGAEYDRNDGYRYSYASSLNAAGQAIGFSNRYSGSAESGRAAWLYDLGVTTRLGFVGDAYDSTGGAHFSEAKSLNDAGQVIGISYRYNGSLAFGQSAWLYDDGTTTRLGFTDSAHTRSDGYQYSWTSSINGAGKVVGWSYRNGGQSAWLYDQGITTRLGLIDPAHPNSDKSEAISINTSGQVAGNSDYSLTSSLYFGQAAWLYEGGTTTRVGLTDSEHTHSNSCKYSEAMSLNQTGNVVGFSYRYSGSTMTGRSAWVYDDGVTTRMGLTDAEHTRSDGYQYSQSAASPKALNEAAQVIGYSQRYSGTSDMGRSVWIYSQGATSLLGMTDSQHTKLSGYRFSEGFSINEQGQAIGISYRYDGNDDNGISGWFYDDDLKQLFSLDFSIAPNGRCFTIPEYLADDGTVLGQYVLYDASGNDLGAYAFRWSIAGGLEELGPLVDGGLTANGWELLGEASSMNSQGDIVGRGFRTSCSGAEFAFLMTPVPEPATWILLLGGLGVFALLPRRLMTPKA